MTPQPRGALFAYDEILGAVARGWTTPANEAKTVDHVLAEAIAHEIQDLLSAGAEGDKFRELAYVPGAWRCPKCKLRIMASVLSAQDGGMSANNDPQACANGCGPMWRITEREDRQEAQRFAIELSERPAPSAGVGREPDWLTDLREFLAANPNTRAITLSRYEVEHLLQATPPASAARESLYSELLLAAQQKFPNESRHETALRYIRERESRSSVDSGAKLAAQGGSDK